MRIKRDVTCIKSMVVVTRVEIICSKTVDECLGKSFGKSMVRFSQQYQRQCNGETSVQSLKSFFILTFLEDPLACS